MHGGAKGLDLLEQAIDKFLRAAHRQSRDIVDGLLRIQLGALPTGLRQRIHQVCFYAQQSQLKYLKQATGTCTHDDHFSLD